MNKPIPEFCDSNEFLAFWQLFYDFNERLQYPCSEGYNDQKHFTKLAEEEYFKLKDTFKGLA